MDVAVARVEQFHSSLNLINNILSACDHNLLLSQTSGAYNPPPTMPKRYLSPAPLPAAKRLHTSKDSSNATQSRARLSFNDSLYDELILCIFSYLSWGDLCTAQATNRNWYRLAADNELWRNQFLKVFGRSRLRGSKGFVSRSDGREVRPLPGRVNSKQDGVKDWKWMFRISSNWRRGVFPLSNSELKLI